MAVTGGAEILSRRVRIALDEQRSPDEEILFCLQGDFSQALVALSSRLLLIKPGFMAGATFGARTASLPYADITGIEINKGPINTVVEISTPSYQATAEKNWWSMGRDRDPMRLSNCLPIATADLEHYQPYLDELWDLIRRTKVRGSDHPGQKTVADHLKELAEFREAGVLTTAEFERAKKRTLDRG